MNSSALFSINVALCLYKNIYLIFYSFDLQDMETQVRYQSEVDLHWEKFQAAFQVIIVPYQLQLKYLPVKLMLKSQCHEIFHPFFALNTLSAPQMEIVSLICFREDI